MVIDGNALLFGITCCLIALFFGIAIGVSLEQERRQRRED